MPLPTNVFDAESGAAAFAEALKADSFSLPPLMDAPSIFSTMTQNTETSFSASWSDENSSIDELNDLAPFSDVKLEPSTPNAFSLSPSPELEACEAAVAAAERAAQAPPSMFNGARDFEQEVKVQEQEQTVSVKAPKGATRPRRSSVRPSRLAARKNLAIQAAKQAAREAPLRVASRQNKLKRKAPSQSTQCRGLTKTEQELSATLDLTRDELLNMTSDALEEYAQRLAATRPLTAEEQKRFKRQRRLIKNRESAQLSRLRKKAYVDELEKQIADLNEEKERYRRRCEAQAREIAQLRAAARR